ncbi:4'-phosphopantetheinyl transferase family protein [Streptomyces longisporoflavus]|uniref:4'-phosphopantetheinyl transferase family protein n=1 Tax=Streptomyces longisporoflavus TaxID=28044 RepID=A0ABW7QZF8_9ACTN
MTEIKLVRPAPLDVSLLDADERRRAAALRRPADQELYAAAHSALRRHLGARLSVDPAAVELVRLPCPLCGGPHGRPAVASGAGPHFSLSHTDGLALLAFADRPVGADVERLPSEEVLTDVAASLHPREQDELAGLPVAERPLAFARCWTRKEACLKGTGEGLAGGGMATLLVGTGPEPLGVPGWTVRDVAVPEGYAAAVAVADRADRSPSSPTSPSASSVRQHR